MTDYFHIVPNKSGKPARSQPGPSAPSEESSDLALEEPRHSLDQLVVTAATRLEIDSAILRIKHHDTLYETWGLKEIDSRGRSIAINLYGPPGTGKSMCSGAIAQALGKKILRVSYADLESKYVGDTPKNIVKAFRTAESADAVLFFDEADSILGKRLSSVTQSADHGVNVSRTVMLMNLDRFVGIVLFATNFPGNYDSAFVRRILCHIELGLPDEACRRVLWERSIPRKLPCDPDVRTDLDFLVQSSEGLSGADIVNVVVKSAMRAITRQGELQRVTRDDVSEVIANVRAAQRHVGGARPTSLSQEILSKEQSAALLRQHNGNGTLPPASG